MTFDVEDARRECDSGYDVEASSLLAACDEIERLRENVEAQLRVTEKVNAYWEAEAARLRSLLVVAEEALDEAADGWPRPNKYDAVLTRIREEK